MVKLKDIVDYIQGLVYGKADESPTETSKKILTASNIILESRSLDISNTRYLLEEKEVDEKYLIKKRDIFICTSSGSLSHLGKSTFIQQDLENYYYGGFCAVLREKTEFNIALIFQYLQTQHFKNYIKEKIGQNINNLKRDYLLDFKIPFPPKKIQEKIVAEIEVLEAKEAESKAKIEKLKRTSNELIVSNKSAKLEKLENLASFLKRGKSAKYGTSNIQIIKSGQARGYKNFDFSTKHFVDENFVLDERQLQKGDILINSTGVGTAGRVTLFNLDGFFVADSHITILRPNAEIALPDFILYSLANIGFKNIEAMALGQSGQIELSLTIIKNIKISLPSIKEQQKVVSQIVAIETQIAALEKELATLPQQKEAILAKYL